MRKFWLVLGMLIFFGGIWYICYMHNKIKVSEEESAPMMIMGPEKVKGEPKKAPNEWFYRQRAYPYPEIRQESFQQALGQAKRDYAATSAHLRTPEWEFAGPTNIGARITDLAVHPDDPNTIYAGAASGGIIKSTDGGTTWQPIFDDVAPAPMGAVAIDPNNPDILYAGTGEANASSYSFFGVGMFKSTDAGATWSGIGLEDTRYIGRIAIDPENSNRLFVAACGKLFGTNAERGIYRSTNGGDSWERVLFVSDSTAAIDVALKPDNPNVVYAAMWERVRGLNYRKSGGHTSGLWKSTDGGNTWSEMTNGLPQGSNVGRPAIGVTPDDPNYVYAIYADDPGYFLGVYRSTDAGSSWTQLNSNGLENMYRSFGWYFGRIQPSPLDKDLVYVLGVSLHRTTNGGQSWVTLADYGIGDIHVDHHALWINPADGTVINGNDGGIYASTNNGTSWTKFYDLPISQFYAIAIDHSNPHRLYGGTQDNGTLRTWDGSTDNWDHILGGDGFYCLVHPQNSNIIWAESQYGNLQKSTDGGNDFNSALSGIDNNDRTNWSTPVVMDPTNPDVMYYGSMRVYRSTNGANSWTPISGDLTNGYSGSPSFNTITTIAVATTDPNVIYVGTDDGNVQVTFDGGDNWHHISADLPNRWITRVAVDPTDALIAYVTLSGFRWEEEIPHVFRTTDGGNSWTNISGNLPEAPVNVLIIDPENTNVLYVGTDFGVYYTQNLGGFWRRLGGNHPLCPVVDLKLHNPTRKLVSGTYGRSMFTLDLESIDTEGFQGYITDSNSGDPVNHVRVFVPDQGYEAFSDENGHYFLPTPPGTYTLHAERFGYADWLSEMEYTVAVEETVEVDITLTPHTTGHFSGSVSSSRGGMVAGAQFTASGVPIDPFYTDERGMFATNLPGDYEYTFTISAPDHDPQELTVFIPAGGETEETLQLNFVQSFESSDGAFTRSNGFNEWEWGTPTENGGPPAAYEGQNVWGTDLDGLYDPVRNYALFSPVFSLAQTADETKLVIQTWYETNEGWDGGNVAISVDGGTTWHRIDPTGGYPSHSIVAMSGQPGFSGSSNGWRRVEFPLDDYRGQSVKFRFRFGATNSQGRGWFFDNFAVYGATDFYTAIDGLKLNQLATPAVVQLGQNYPNPFNPSTTIPFALPEAASVSVKVYDMNGKLIRVLADGIFEAGHHRLVWDGKNEQGQAARSGVYVYRLETGNQEQSKSMQLIK